MQSDLRKDKQQKIKIHGLYLFFYLMYIIVKYNSNFKKDKKSSFFFKDRCLVFEL